jgi:hypothetical protein
MNYALPTVHDIDAQLRDVAELRGLLDGFVQCAGGMTFILAKREQALRDCRESLVAHHAEIAERARHEAAQQSLAAPVGVEATPPEDEVTSAPTLSAEQRMLSFASIDGASSNQSQVPAHRT